jgi:hypothetical protein
MNAPTGVEVDEAYDAFQQALDKWLDALNKWVDAVAEAARSLK